MMKPISRRCENSVSQHGLVGFVQSSILNTKAWRQIVAIIHERTKRTLGGRGVIPNVRSYYELKMAILLINFCTFSGKSINNILCINLCFSVCLYANFYMTIFHITFFWGQHPAGSRLF